MNNKTYIGIDNGVSGSIAFLFPDKEPIFQKVLTKKELNYTKKKGYITRIDFEAMDKFFDKIIYHDLQSQFFVAVERPMVNPTRFKATTSALRSLESILILIEEYNLSFRYIDSKEWQKDLLPAGLRGPELKTGSLEIGNRLYPQFKSVKHPDRDGLLIAEYCKRKGY